MSERILVVDDELDTLEIFTRLIRKNTPYEVETSPSGEEALALLKERDVDLIIADYKMPNMDGLELLKRVKDNDPEQLFIMITAFGTIEIAVEAMKQGAFDFITKPLEKDHILFSIRRAIDWKKIRGENVLLRREISQAKLPRKLVGESKAIKEVFTLIKQVAPTDTTVLITGESGTGKELVARMIHAQSLRNKEKFITIDWGTIPESLIESELFGHRKGSFTGALSNKRGLLREADGGTVFLDEIGDAPLHIQSKLLRFIQEGEIKPVGNPKTQKVDTRIIAATNKNLETLVKEGKFREDLFYRLNVFRISVPPLRERREDIPLLANYFLEINNSRFRKQIKRIAPSTLNFLEQHNWPGNVRELENVMERAVILCERDTILPENLSFFSPPIKSGEEYSQILKLPYKEARNRILQEFNQKYLSNILKNYEGNITRAAEGMNMKRQSLQHLIKKYKVTFPKP
ncbi:MAG: sigma-54-dependent Fis family transcriptional regulator [Deltaproteobacteria bacterium]|nr:MAG: sigma-54-dependent Fis family transcriptional regulator [Deltaproteobacteria bacterium]